MRSTSPARSLDRTWSCSSATSSSLCRRVSHFPSPAAPPPPPAPGSAGSCAAYAVSRLGGLVVVRRALAVAGVRTPSNRPLTTSVIALGFAVSLAIAVDEPRWAAACVLGALFLAAWGSQLPRHRMWLEQAAQ